MEYKFSELFLWTSGKSINPTSGEIPIYGSNGVIGYTDIAKYSNKIILGRVGAYCGSVEYCKGNFNATDNTLVTTCNEDQINYDYAYYLLKQYNLNSFAGGSAQPLITQSILKHLKCNIHSLILQKKIASILNNYDQLIENNNKRIKLLEDMAESIYKEWFVRFRFPGYKNIKFVDSMPTNFEIKKIGELVDLYRGVGYSSEDIACGDMTLLSMNNIRPFGGFIRDFSRPFCGKYKASQVLKENDLIMCITDMTQERRVIGYVGLVTPCKKTMIACTHLIKLTTKGISNLFLYSMFTYSNLSKEISIRATGTNVLGLTAEIIEKVKTLVPEKMLIDKYVQKIEPIYTQIKNLQLANENLILQRDSLLPRLMSGKLEVK